jgi:hypothetical protein
MRLTFCAACGSADDLQQAAAEGAALAVRWQPCGVRRALNPLDLWSL